jgi:protein involved in polysaccharide export with SLBB domain
VSSMYERVARVISALSLSAALTLGGEGIATAAPQIHPGDKLTLTVFNHPDLSEQLTVTSEGDVRVPVAGNVSVDGLSEAGAAARVQAALAMYLFHPSVDVRVVSQGQSIFFTGPLVGVAPFAPGETLGAAIGAFRQTLSAQSNNSPGTAASISSIDLRRVRVSRARKVSPAVDLEALARSGGSGPRLEPGDVVLLSAKPVRVDIRGNLAAPAVVYVYPGDTLAQAVAEAGPLSAGTSLSAIGLRRDGADTVVSSAGGAFTAPAHDGDVVTLQPAPHVSVLGMVEKAGDTTLQTRPTLLNALYEAGGPNRFADLSHVKVTHEGQTLTYNISKLTHGDLSQNFALHDGDVVFVPEGHKIDLGGFTNALTALTSLRILGL